MPTYPYSSGQTAVVQAFERLRKGFPAKADAGYLQRFSIAPANESYIISILRFLGLIDEEGNRVEATTGHFYAGDDDFKPGLEQLLRNAYTQLFEEMGDEALTADKATLTSWFRAADKTSDLVGQRQGVHVSDAGRPCWSRGDSCHPVERTEEGGDPGSCAYEEGCRQEAHHAKVDDKAPARLSAQGQQSAAKSDVGLTVRIEVNLPPGGDAETYDAIFASIRKHLMP